MTFENFKNIIDQMVNNSKKITSVYDTGIDLIDFVDSYERVIRSLWIEVLTDSGLEWLDWFLYEKDYIHDGVGNPEIKAVFKSHNPLTNEVIEVEIIKNIEELHEYLTQNNYFKCASQK